MPTTVCLYFRGDGATRALEVFRRALGADAESLSIHANRDDSGYYGSADVQDVEAARVAFASARQPFPTLKAYIGILPSEREEAMPRGGQQRAGEPRGRQHEPKQAGNRNAEGRAGSNGATPPRGQERSRPAQQQQQPEQSAEQNGRKAPLRFRNRNERRRRPEGEKPPDREPQA